MTPLADAQRFVLDAVPDPVVVTLDRGEATWSVLAEPVVATETVPPFDNTALDGYAVRAADTESAPVELVVSGEIAAGAPPDVPVTEGACVRIMTGAPMPEGADAIVMVENSERLGVGDDGVERVRLTESVDVGTGVRSAGDDVHVGDELFPAGAIVTPPVEAMLASVNAQQVAVYRRPTVAVLSTGDELISDGSPLEPGQIRESNLCMLRGMLLEARCDVIDLGVIPDDEAELERVLLDVAERCDAIVSSGGVSMGDYDIVKAVLGRIADMTWMQVAIKPAKPFAFGTLTRTDGKRVPIFGLPGNPVSSLLSFELLARPALRQMAGHSTLTRLSMRAVADVDIPRRPDGKTHVMRCTGSFEADGRYHVRPVGAQGSHQLAATSTADAVILVRDGDGLAVGDEVDALLLTG